jgi:hypothetical protein
MQTANVVYIQRKIQLSGFSAYPDGSPSQLIRINGVLLYTARLQWDAHILRIDNSRISITRNGWKIPWKICRKTTTEMGRKYQVELLVAAEYKKMDTRRGRDICRRTTGKARALCGLWRHFRKRRT